jgi:hypothetical protein
MRIGVSIIGISIIMTMFENNMDVRQDDLFHGGRPDIPSVIDFSDIQPDDNQIDRRAQVSEYGDFIDYYINGKLERRYAGLSLDRIVAFMGKDGKKPYFEIYAYNTSLEHEDGIDRDNAMIISSKYGRLHDHDEYVLIRDIIMPNWLIYDAKKKLSAGQHLNEASDAKRKIDLRRTVPEMYNWTIWQSAKWPAMKFEIAYPSHAKARVTGLTPAEAPYELMVYVLRGGELASLMDDPDTAGSKPPILGITLYADENGDTKFMNKDAFKMAMEDIQYDMYRDAEILIPDWMADKVMADLF